EATKQHTSFLQTSIMNGTESGKESSGSSSPSLPFGRANAGEEVVSSLAFALPKGREVEGALNLLLTCQRLWAIHTSRGHRYNHGAHASFQSFADVAGRHIRSTDLWV
ncbi:hypothetical protein IscW_ISCW004158, partial [Ixodes scapularis]